MARALLSQFKSISGEALMRNLVTVAVLLIALPALADDASAAETRALLHDALEQHAELPTAPTELPQPAKHLPVDPAGRATSSEATPNGLPTAAARLSGRASERATQRVNELILRLKARAIGSLQHPPSSPTPLGAPADAQAAAGRGAASSGSLPGAIPPGAAGDRETPSTPAAPDNLPGRGRARGP